MGKHRRAPVFKLSGELTADQLAPFAFLIAERAMFLFSAPFAWSVG